MRRDACKFRTFVLVLACAGLLALPSVTSGAVTPNSGTFRGTTAQGYAVSLTVKGGAIKVLKFRYQVGGCGATVNVTGKIPVSGGKFRYSSSSYDPTAGRTLTTVVTGTFGTSNSIKGSIKASTACGSKSIGYKAKL